ncbi:hypothetical protein [Dyadobacter sp.]|uniref:hypothetical protein n=1 Tax=Dyadobacter sp. TaxID=1914288 RepID=UPI003F71074C
MTKEITLCVPRYVYKFILAEPDYDFIEPNVIEVPKLSELGHLIHGFSRHIPHNQIFQPVQPTKNTVNLTVRYLCKLKAFDVPVEKYPDLVAFLKELFRASLIREVSAIHTIHPNPDYGWMVKAFLDRRGIITSDSLDKDIDLDRVRKVYRDHLARVDKKNRRMRKLSMPVLSGFSPVCRV